MKQKRVIGEGKGRRDGEEDVVLELQVDVCDLFMNANRDQLGVLTRTLLTNASPALLTTLREAAKRSGFFRERRSKWQLLDVSQMDGIFSFLDALQLGIARPNQVWDGIQDVSPRTNIRELWHTRFIME